MIGLGLGTHYECIIMIMGLGLRICKCKHRPRETNMIVTSAEMHEAAPMCYGLPNTHLNFHALLCYVVYVLTQNVDPV